MMHLPDGTEAGLAQNLFDLTGKVAVNIGGTSGIGHAISLGFARAGATVVASSRRHAVVDSTADELEKLGSETLRLTSDVQDRASLEKLCDERQSIWRPMQPSSSRG